MPAVEALTAVTIEHFVNCPTGIVEHYFESPALHWSDKLYRIHGYERGEIYPPWTLVSPTSNRPIRTPPGHSGRTC